MKVVRGTNVYPRAIEEIVRGCDGIEEFQIRLYTEEGSATRSRCSSSPQPRAPRRDAALAELTRGSPRRTRACASTSALAERESLPRFELKAKRLRRRARGVGIEDDRKVM